MQETLNRRGGMSLSHGNTQTGNRPGCWGQVTVFDSENRECRDCGFRESCRAQVMKTISTQQVAVQQVSNVPSYYAAFPQHQQTQYAAPQQLPMYQPQQQAMQPRPFIPAAPSYAVPTRVGPPMPVPQSATPQMQPQQMQQVQTDWYGRIQDPLFFPMMSAPPFRPQMAGETFFERVAKNMLLDGLSMAFSHLTLAVRQMVLPPQPLQPKEKDITPR